MNQHLLLPLQKHPNNKQHEANAEIDAAKQKINDATTPEELRGVELPIPEDVRILAGDKSTITVGEMVDQYGKDRFDYLRDKEKEFNRRVKQLKRERAEGKNTMTDQEIEDKAGKKDPGIFARYGGFKPGKHGAELNWLRGLRGLKAQAGAGKSQTMNVNIETEGTDTTEPVPCGKVKGFLNTFAGELAAARDSGVLGEIVSGAAPDGESIEFITATLTTDREALRNGTLNLLDSRGNRIATATSTSSNGNDTVFRVPYTVPKGGDKTTTVRVVLISGGAAANSAATDASGNSGAVMLGSLTTSGSSNNSWSFLPGYSGSGTAVVSTALGTALREWNDGTFGPKTRAAIAAFQEANNLEDSNRINRSYEDYMSSFSVTDTLNSGTDNSAASFRDITTALWPGSGSSEEINYSDIDSIRFRLDSSSGETMNITGINVTFDTDLSTPNPDNVHIYYDDTEVGTPDNTDVKTADWNFEAVGEAIKVIGVSVDVNDDTSSADIAIKCVYVDPRNKGKCIDAKGNLQDVP
ncbi:MAG: peptidoglycan-binding protein [Deltaproteobacteria bacterium]|nr:peptidoglycan-binding protein [Deltaproteobacteria bacterium]